MAVVKKIIPAGAFCSLPEYEEREAFLPISEVAPRWIKNIHEFISLGQRYVVKVYHVDTEKNQVDISIKRVSEEEKKHKLESIKSEKRGEKLLELALKDKKADLPKITSLLSDEFGDVYSCFREIVYEGEEVLKKIDLPKEIKTRLVDIARKNIKKPTVEVNRILNLSNSNVDGLEQIKKILSIPDVEVSYLGAPRYQIKLTAPDYKAAEKKLSSILENIKAFAQKNNCEFDVEK